MRGSPWGRLTGTTRRLYGCSCYGDPTGHVIHCHGDRDLSDNDILGRHSRARTLEVIVRVVIVVPVGMVWG